MWRLVGACLAFFCSWSGPVGAQEKDPLVVYEQVAQAGQALLTGDELLKLDAAALLGELGAVYSVGVLQQALSDPSAMVRMAAVDALGRIAHPDAVVVLVGASEDANPLVAIAAVTALGDMHIDESYEALMTMLGQVEDADLKDAVLDGLRKWNEPFTPLPSPVELPPGKDVPDYQGGGMDVVEPVKATSKAIDVCNPYDPESGIPPEKCMEVHTDPGKKGQGSGIDTKNPYGPMAGTMFSSLGLGGSIDPRNPYDLPWTVGATESVPPYFVIQGPPGGEEEMPEAVFVPPLALDLWNLQGGSLVDYRLVTASTGSRTGRMVSMRIAGEWVGRWIGVGGAIGFGGASTSESATGIESWTAGNLSLWFRHLGSRELGKVTLTWGAALTLSLPTASHIPVPTDDSLGPRYHAAAAAHYASYYQHGLNYPDLENSFKAAVRPDLDIGLVVGPVTLQLELGFDAIVLGETRVPSTGEKKDLTDVGMMHMGLGLTVRPLRWLQVSMEITSVFELGGTSMATRVFDAELAGRPAHSEAFVTPAVTLLLPVRSEGTIHLLMGVRVPLGDVGSASGPMRLDPMFVMAAGFRFPSPLQDPSPYPGKSTKNVEP